MKKQTLKLFAFIALSAITTHVKAQPFFSQSSSVLTSDNGIDIISFHNSSTIRALLGNTSNYFQLYANSNQDNGPSLFMFTGTTAYADPGTIRFQSTNSTVGSTTSSFEVVNHPNSSTYTPLFKVKSNGDAEVTNDLKVNATVYTWNSYNWGDGYIDGYLRIGNGVSLPSGYKLYVEDGILTEKVKVALSSDPTNWSDFVFDENYDLRPLSDVEKFIKKNKHLPEIPSTEEVHKEGLDLAQMDAKLLQKVEELTLYVIQQQKEINELKKQLKR